MVAADYEYIGKDRGVITLYRGIVLVRSVPQAQGVCALVDLIKSDGRWIASPVGAILRVPLFAKELAVLR